MRSRLACTVVVAAGVGLHAGCARQTHGFAGRFLLNRDAKQAAAQPKTPPDPSLEEAIGKLRHLMAAARPAPKGAPTPTLEMRDAELRTARANLAAAPSAERHVAVGRAYHRHGVLNEAYEHYSRALRMNHRAGDAYEGLARVWRDWRLPHLALADAQRAVYYAPASAAAENTRGTILQALGLLEEARSAYKLAFLLDRGAAYAFNNLCYLSFVEGRASQAISECEAALRIAPDLPAAHNNLGLVYAAVGRLDLARQQFAQAGDRATASYNMGVVHLARREYEDAARTFDAAHADDPTLADAARRGRDARRRIAVATPDEERNER